MALAANVLNAIGGAPSTGPVGDGPSPVPVYPAKVPYIDGMPEIRPAGLLPGALDEFIEIERPAERNSPDRRRTVRLDRRLLRTRSRLGCEALARRRCSTRGAQGARGTARSVASTTTAGPAR